MKKIILVPGMVVLSLQLFAQIPPGPGNDKPGHAPSIGHVFGKVVDSLGKPISGASVLILRGLKDTASKKQKDLLLNSFITKTIGEFSFEQLPVAGTLKLVVTSTGYLPSEQTLSFMNGVEKDLGKIKLTRDVKVLSAITVVASSSSLKLDIDKKVFNVGKDITSQGGTGLDVMRNVPSVQVDIDGNVKLRNAAPQLYIDGRPTTLSLDQIPADAIESVEVITNPSAKYDASGGNAGILNIILKKNRKTGYNGNLRAGIDRRGGINGGGDFNIRMNKVNFSASVMVNQNKGRSTGTVRRLNLVDTPQTFIHQDNHGKTNGAFTFGKLGFDYFVTNRLTLSIGGAIKIHGEFKPRETIDIYTDSLFNAGIVTTYSQRKSTGKREFNANGLQGGLKYTFPKEGVELTADGNYFSGKNNSNSLYVTDYYDNNGAVANHQAQQVIAVGNNKFGTIQTDYVNPLTKKTKLETGLRVQLRKIKNNNDTYFQDQASKEFIKIANATSNYRNTDNVYAAYVSVSSSIKDFGYKIGLRAESSSYTGELTNTGEKFKNSYPVSLFPTVFLSQKLKNKQELQFSYTRRINRPNFFQLIPYTDYSDSLNITKGNPNLVPEFTTAMEFTYSKTFPNNNNILASIYYKQTNNLITRYLRQDINPITGKEDLISTFINANSSNAYGAELTSINNITKWLDITTNVNLYNSKINTDNVKGGSQNSLWSWFGKFNSNFKLPKNYTIQLSANYQSKTNLPVSSGGQGMGGPGGFGQAQSASQGYISSFYFVDLAIRKTFLKNNAASVSLSFSDIFATRKSNQHSESEFFIQDYNRIRDPQMLRLNFSYRFGKIDVTLNKRKNNNTQSMQDAQSLQ